MQSIQRRRPTKRVPPTVFGQSPHLVMQAITRKWLLRGLYLNNGWKRLVSELLTDEDDDEDDEMDKDHWFEERNCVQVCRFLGLDPRKLMQMPRDKISAYIRRTNKPLPQNLHTKLPNLVTLGCDLALSDLEQNLVLFAAALKMRGPFEPGFNYLGGMSNREHVLAAVASCLNVAAEDVARALSRNRILAQAGLVTMEQVECGAYDAEDWFEILPGLGAWLLDPEPAADAFLSTYLKPQTEPARSLDDFRYLGMVLEVVYSLIRGALDHPAQGVNLLLYGPPGTGKTALARALVSALGARLLEVAASNPEGALSQSERIKALCFVGRIGALGKPAVILFDEVEDYFCENEDEFFGSGPSVGMGKGFSIDLIEGAPAPTIWITNRVDQIDPALLRRFSHILEIPPPPSGVRNRIAGAHLAPLGLAEHSVRERIATHEQLTPGLVAQAARSATLAVAAGVDERAQILESVLNGHLRALGRPPLAAANASVTPYELGFLNVSANLPALETNLIRRGSGRLLFYGQPGTGKTALVRHFAERAGRPLLACRASDLIGPYVGETEQKIASMFAQAATQGAWLLLDECDSFLYARGRARQSWEVSLVNEMLTQMESFAGIFVATTNLVDGLDEAIFRRFDVKLKFAPLTHAQSCALFRAVLAERNIALPDPLPDPLPSRLRDLPGLTPGDFAAAVRGMSLSSDAFTVEALIATLTSDLALKTRGRGGRPIGFLAQFNPALN